MKIDVCLTFYDQEEKWPIVLKGLIANRDLIVVRNCVMLLAAMVVIVNFVVDVLYAVIDPRVKASDL